MNIFLAGCDSAAICNTVTRAKIENILFSYYHAANPQELLSACDTTGVKHIICDSGLFTMMFGAGKGKVYDESDLRQYTAQYIKTAQSWRSDKLTIVECDVHKILGMRQVYEFRKRFEDCGIPVLYVWHVEEGIDGLYRMAEKYKYIALSIPELRKVFKGKATRYEDATYDLLQKIKKNVSVLPRIHLLGNTVRETMENTIAWSCDSTSWKASGRYGRGDVFLKNQFVKCSIKSELWDKELRENWDEDLRYAREKISAGASAETTVGFITMAKQYYKYQQWLNAHYQWAGNDEFLKGRI